MSSPLEALKAELEHFGESNDAATKDRPRRMLNITRDTGEFLAVLARATGARRVLEIGTSNGYSTLWLAEAARAIGASVTTVEFAPPGIRPRRGFMSTTLLEVPWPAVTRHPVSGRSILFVNPMHTHGFVGMKREEAWPLIEELADHATQERFVYYHRWRVGDVLIWDERATMHRGAGDYRPDERRIMLRTIVYPN